MISLLLLALAQSAVPATADDPALLTPSARAAIEACDRKVRQARADDWDKEAAIREEWQSLLKAPVLDVARLRTAAERWDKLRGNPGTFVGWVDMLEKMKGQDRTVLVALLRKSGSGSLPLASVPTAPPIVATPSRQKDAARVARDKAMATYFDRLGQLSNRPTSEPSLPARLKEAGRKAYDAGRRVPFDRAEFRAALQAVGNVENERKSKNSDDIVEVLAGMPDDQRAMVLDAMFQAVRPAVPPPLPVPKR